MFYSNSADLLIALHFRLSQIFYTTSLIDTFAYNLNYKSIKNDSKMHLYNQNLNILVKIFNQWVYNFNYILFTTIKKSINSVETLFLNSI
jgi:hypothetical protein